MAESTFMITLAIVSLFVIDGVRSSTQMYLECKDTDKGDRVSCGDGQSQTSCTRRASCCWDPNGEIPCYKKKTITVDPLDQTEGEGNVCRFSNRGDCATFDNYWFRSTGACTYIVATDGCKEGDKPTFKITTDFNRIQTGKFPTAPKTVFIEIEDVEIKVTGTGKITYNGTDVTLIGGTLPGKIFLQQTINFVSVTTELFDLKWGHYRGEMTLTMSPTLKGKVCGICGNYNGNKEDDFNMGNAKLCATINPDIKAEVKANHSNMFLASWLAGKTCPGECKRSKHDITCNQDDKEAAEEFCQDLQREYGACNGEDIASQYAGCVQSLCIATSSKVASYKKIQCAHASLMYEKCRQNKNEVDWNSTYCSDVNGYECPVNAEHKCGHMEEPTCRNSDPTKHGECMMGCFCKKGSRYDGKNCILPEDCGCMVNDVIITINTTVITDNCRLDATCKGSGKAVKKERSDCPRNGLCYMNHDGSEHECPCKMTEDLKQNKRGFNWCYPKGMAKCDVRGAQHYWSFDGVSHSFVGSCRYILATDGCNGKDATFTIYADNRRPKVEREVTRMDSVSIKFAEHCTFHIGAHGDFEDNVRIADYQLPYKGHCNPNIIISPLSGGNRLLTLTDPDTDKVTMKIMWKYKSNRTRIYIPGALSGKVCGLCGNSNADQDDEFTMGPFPLENKPPLIVEGTTAEDLRYLGYSWTYEIDSDAGCIDEVTRLNEPDPSPPAEDLSEAEKHCMKALTPFENLLNAPKIDRSEVDMLFEICKEDTAWLGDENNANLCTLAEDIAEVLKDSYNMTVPDWRESLAECSSPSCGDNQHYIDSEFKQPSCFKTVSFDEGGCQCEIGYVLSGETCIKRKDCGCNYHGNRIPIGETVTLANCSKVTCTDEAKISLEEVICGTNANCTVSEGERKCMCAYGYKGDGFTCEEIINTDKERSCNALDTDKCELMSRTPCGHSQENERCSVGVMTETRKCSGTLQTVTRGCCLMRCDLLRKAEAGISPGEEPQTPITDDGTAAGSGTGSGSAPDSPSDNGDTSTGSSGETGQDSSEDSYKMQCKDVFPYCDPNEPGAKEALEAMDAELKKIAQAARLLGAL